MSTILSSVVLTFALYQSWAVTVRCAKGVIHDRAVSLISLDGAFAALAWGLFYYLTHR